MDLAALRFKVQYCVDCAEEAKRDDVRKHWLVAAESWQLAIETRLMLQQLRAETVRRELEQDCGRSQWPHEKQ